MLSGVVIQHFIQCKIVCTYTRMSNPMFPCPRLKNYSLRLHASAVAASPCRVRLRKWHTQLRLSRNSQLEPSSDVGDFPTTEVTLVVNNPTVQTRFKSLLRRSMSPRGDKPDPDQGFKLMAMVKTEYNDFTELRPDRDSTPSPPDSNIHHDL